MDTAQVKSAFKNLDRRLAKIEQKLPTLATKDELQAAVAKLATKDELQAAVATLATKDELQAAVAKLATKDELRAAVAKLATKADVAACATKDELRETRDELKRHTQVLYESLHTDIQLLAEHVASSLDQSAATRALVLPRLDNHEIRILALEDRKASRTHR